MSTFSKLRKSTKNNLEKLQKKIEENADRTNRFADERFWTYQADDSGNAQVTMRFLPLWDGANEAADLPIVKVWSHSFMHNGQWYIDECRNTISGKVEDGVCPVCDWVYEYTTSKGGWNAMSDADRMYARSGGDIGRSKRTQFIANVYIINDKANPENNGKTFLWKFGPQINGIIEGAMKPEFDDEVVIDPFDLWDGANFNLRVRKVEGQTEYKKSSFDKPSRMLPTDQEMEEAWLKCVDLTEFSNPDKFNSYEKQQERLNIVLGNKPKRVTPKVNEPTVSEEVQETIDNEEELDSFLEDMLDD